MSRYITSGNKTTISAINAELEKISTSIQELLSRNGEAPNQMLADLDMNSNRILNLPYPNSDREPLRRGDVNLTNPVEATIPPTYFNIADYGASTSNTGEANKIAIDNAIAALDSAGGGVLWIPRGMFRTTGGHSIVANMAIKGESQFVSTLKIATGNADDGLFVKPSPDTVISNFEISNIKLEGIWDETRRQGTTGSLVSGRNIQNVVIFNVTFMHGRYFGINLNKCTDVRVVNNRFYYICRDACGVWNSPNTLVAHNIFKGNDDDTISLNSAGFEPLDGIVKTRIVVIGNQLEDCGGIKVQSANTTIISNNILQRNKGNQQIGVVYDNAAGTYQTNPQTVLITDNIITDIVDRFLSANLSPSVNARIGIKVNSAFPTVDAFTNPYSNYYTTSGAANTDGFRQTSGIVIKGNILKRTLPAVTNYSDWGFGQMFTRFSTDTFASNGFADPEVQESYMSARLVEIDGSLRDVIMRDNVFAHTCQQLVDFQLASGDTATDGYFQDVYIVDNDFSHCSARAIALEGFENTHQDIQIIRNKFNLDPLMEASTRNADGSWSSGTTCVGVYASNVSGIEIRQNKFKNLAAPYIQGGATNTIVKYGNTFVGEPFAGVALNTYSASNKGLGLFPSEVILPESLFIYEDSDPTSPTYGDKLVQQSRSVSGNAPPTEGFYFDGQILFSQQGVLSSGTTTLGFRRLTTGTGTVVGTDWEELRTAAVSAGIEPAGTWSLSGNTITSTTGNSWGGFYLQDYFYLLNNTSPEVVHRYSMLNGAYTSDAVNFTINTPSAFAIGGWWDSVTNTRWLVGRSPDAIDEADSTFTSTGNTITGIVDPVGITRMSGFYWVVDTLGVIHQVSLSTFLPTGTTIETGISSCEGIASFGGTVLRLFVLNSSGEVYGINTDGTGLASEISTGIASAKYITAKQGVMMIGNATEGVEYQYV